MGKDHSPRFLQVVEDAKSRISELDPDGLRDRLEENPDLLLVDVREESEFEESHVRGARHLSKGVLERDIEEEVPNTERELVLYCGGGYRSALAADNLRRMGYRNVHSLDGGFRALRTHDYFTIDSP